MYETKEEINIRAKQAIGKKLGEICPDIDDRAKKGGIGQAIEEFWFGYKPNSNAEPDFKEAGVELKVTGYIRDKNNIPKAKERLVLNIINYMEEYVKTFETSSFWHKNQFIQLMLYEYLKTVPKSKWTIDAAHQFTFPEEDLIIIKHDFEIILGKIKNGLAHEISEGDTLYLGACTKGANASSVRTQPFSNIPAKQRAYSLKQSYMTQIIQKYIFKIDTKNEQIIKSSKELLDNNLENYVAAKIAPQIGKLQKDLINEFNITAKSNTKSINEIIISRILGLKGKISSCEEFIKANITVKTIRVNKDGKSIKESMSFPTFNPVEIATQDWEDSDLYNTFYSSKFLFIIFQFNENNELYLKGIKFWNMPFKDLLEVEKVWNKTSEIFRTGTLTLEKTKKGISNNLPKKTENTVCHVRPHGRDASDTILIPDGREITKQCFWLNNDYIFKQISN